VNHWRIETLDEIGTLTLDVAGQSANLLSQEVLRELDEALAAIARQPPRGLIILSSKRGGFSPGADIREFERAPDTARAVEIARTGQRVFARLAALPCPTVAAIHGYCLGGGLELALACTYRIARDDSSTRLGLPEVLLGLHPGFAGSLRLPQLIGALPALDLMLTGRPVSAAQAHRLGLVDRAVPERHFLNAARAYAREAPSPPRARLVQRLLATAPLRPLVAQFMRRRLRTRTHPGHYPAPYRLIELWRRNATEEQEADSFGELLATRTARNLVRVLLLGEELKRRGRAHRHDIERVHVVGAGVMGGDIAAWAALRGFSVSLQDVSAEKLARAIKRAHALFRDKLKDARSLQETMDRLMPDLKGHGLKRADLVIEAIVERAEPKQKLLRDAEAAAGPNAILATNTSSIPLETLAQTLKDPTRLVGLHFFNPVSKMRLVEIVRGAASGEQALNRARAFAVALDKLPLDVKSSPGFLVNRILMPYLLEAVQLVQEGMAAPVVDAAAREFGMPMGPIELADTIGLDIFLSVAQELAGPLALTVPERLRQLVEDGKLGRKSGEGFYRWNGRARNKPARADKAAIGPVTERLIMRMVNEAAVCLREGVVADADAVDAGMVYGIGFAPFLGGPMRYAESRGETRIIQGLS
jgi:3-hydroxyacyl-CoA dehydrogenase / enoyl-CoA hydratase / 3-hydroxybutyryl-CoA epimerase